MVIQNMPELLVFLMVQFAQENKFFQTLPLYLILSGPLILVTQGPLGAMY